MESGKRPQGGVGEYLDGAPSLGGEHIGLDGKISIDKENLKYVPLEYFKKSKKGILNNNDILICKDGALTGKIALFNETIEVVENQSMINEHIFLLRTNDENNQKYLFNILLSEKGQELLKSNITGQAQGGLNHTNLLNIKIPLPPLEIQEKIVSEIEVLEKQEEKAIEKVARLKLQIIDKANQIFEEFQTVSLGNVCEEPVYGANEKAIAKKSDNDYRYIRITDINDDGSLNNDFKTAENVHDKYILKENDFLFARSGATAGKTFLYKNKYGKALYAGYLIRFRVNESVSADFLNFILKSDNYDSWVLKNRLGSAQPNINAKQFSSFEIPLPPLAEQQKIVAQIEQIEETIKTLKTKLAGIPQEKEAVLKKYL